MKNKLFIILIVVMSILIAAPALGARVNGYYRSNGTYVQPYYRTSPDSRYNNNYSYRGNYNPYSGNYGTNTYGGKTYNYNYKSK